VAACLMLVLDHDSLCCTRCGVSKECVRLVFAPLPPFRGLVLGEIESQYSFGDEGWAPWLDPQGTCSHKWVPGDEIQFALFGPVSNRVSVPGTCVSTNRPGFAQFLAARPRAVEQIRQALESSDLDLCTSLDAEFAEWQAAEEGTPVAQSN
jgi:hypothetical protein